MLRTHLFEWVSNFFYLLQEGGYAFLIHTTSDSLYFSEQQNEAMRALAAEGLTSQEPIRSKEGRFTEIEELKGRSHAIRLLTFAEGVTLESSKVRF